MNRLREELEAASSLICVVVRSSRLLCCSCGASILETRVCRPATPQVSMSLILALGRGTLCQSIAQIESLTRKDQGDNCWDMDVDCSHGMTALVSSPRPDVLAIFNFGIE